VLSKANYLDSAYVKFDAIEAPSPHSSIGGNKDAYDKIFTGVVGDSTIKITGLKKGKYFIYVTGFDSTLSSRLSQRVALQLTEDSSEVIRYVQLWAICCVF
jgi:hypothetical protein